MDDETLKIVTAHDDGDCVLAMRVPADNLENLADGGVDIALYFPPDQMLRFGREIIQCAEKLLVANAAQPGGPNAQ